VSSPSGVWDEATAEVEFGIILAIYDKYDIYMPNMTAGGTISRPTASLCPVPQPGTHFQQPFTVTCHHHRARLNWQLACQFFSANNISYRIVSCFCRHLKTELFSRAYGVN